VSLATKCRNQSPAAPEQSEQRLLCSPSTPDFHRWPRRQRRVLSTPRFSRRPTSTAYLLNQNPVLGSTATYCRPLFAHQQQTSRSGQPHRRCGNLPTQFKSNNPCGRRPPLPPRTWSPVGFSLPDYGPCCLRAVESPTQPTTPPPEITAVPAATIASPYRRISHNLPLRLRTGHDSGHAIAENSSSGTTRRYCYAPGLTALSNGRGGNRAIGPGQKHPGIRSSVQARKSNHRQIVNGRWIKSARTMATQGGFPPPSSPRQCGPWEETPSPTKEKEKRPRRPLGPLLSPAHSSSAKLHFSPASL